MTSSLQSFLNRFVYANLTDEEFVGNLKKISYQDLKDRKLHTSREDYQLSSEENQRGKAHKFYQGFKLTKTMYNPEAVFRNLGFVTDFGPFYLNIGAFLPTIEMLGDQQQVKYWKEEALSGRVVGGYAQTEIGHGSDVKSLETTATYDEKKEVWIMNTPKVTSAKMWVGLLGNFSTHVVLQAKAFVKDQSLGVQTFVIEIRNSKMQLLPSVEAFDIGPKLGLDVIDNGSLLFSNRAIPRESMLMKYIQVSADGIVKGLDNTQAIKYGYGSMLNLRVQLTFGFAIDFNVFPPGHLYQIFKQQGIEKQSQNRSFLIDKLCLGLGIVLSNREVLNLFTAYSKEISAKNFSKADKLLATVHIISSTFKAVSGRLGIDTMKQMISGYQINHFKTSKIPYIFTMSIPGATFEGDNTVLLQQTSKFLLFKMNLEKDFSQVKKGFKSTSREDAISALEYIITQRLIGIKERMDQLGENGVPFKTIWNEKEQVNLVRTSEIWGFMTLLQLIKPALSKISQNQSFFEKISAGFTHNLLKRVHELETEGFKVEWIPTWKAFSDEEYEAMCQIGGAIESQESPMEYIALKEGQWLKAKL